MDEVIEWLGQCPYCGELINIFVDPANNNSHYIEDCSVCCRPINISVSGDRDDSGAYRIGSIELRAEND